MGKHSHKQKIYRAHLVSWRTSWYNVKLSLYAHLPFRNVPTYSIKATMINKATARLCCISWSGLSLFLSFSHWRRSSWGFPWILLGLDPGTNHSSILAWRIPWIEEPGRLQSTGSHRVGHDWSDLATAYTTQETRWTALPPRDSIKSTLGFSLGSSNQSSTAPPFLFFMFSIYFF